ncbi:putative gibberellin 3-beta hydroxylase, partial [Aureobasidium melanogenum]
MSQTTIITESKESLRTVRLHNGDTFTFTSNIATDLENIPVIDAARIWSDEIEDRKAVAEEIRIASHEIGFFYLINHGIDQKYADEAMQQAKGFFALPEQKKMEVFTGLVPNDEAFNWAYDASKDPLAEDKTQASVSIWPSDLPGFRESLYAYHTKLLALSRRLTGIFALALHLPEDFFDQYIRQPEAGMRILHYPEQKHSADDQNGIGAHTDVECFTIVTQDSAGGLEVLSKSGAWIKANPIPGSFVVNIADSFMRQTNDFFVSTIHRVINKSGKERYSAPFFFGFDRAKLLEPVPTCVSDETPMKYPVMTGGEYYKWRTNRQKQTNTRK